MMRDLFLTDRFFWCCGALSLAFVLGFALPWSLLPVIAAGILFLLLIVLDAWWLFAHVLPVDCVRRLPGIAGTGDESLVTLELLNRSRSILSCSLIEELPVQLQERDFEKKIVLPPGEKTQITYTFRPTRRGKFLFGGSILFLSTRLGLLQRRLRANTGPREVRIFPSVLQMKKMELKALNRISTHSGIKKIRRIGHGYEFEQIKSYVPGDDYRSLNWKASSRKAELMVNKYEDERAQQLYCLIDKSRVMHMPFNGLSLMEYAINATLAISNVALKKYDKAGLITFSDVLGSAVKADSKPLQLQLLLNQLYREAERPAEANYELLYFAARKLITGRSLILLFTNFESTYALERALPILRKINRFHLLVAIVFENSEIAGLAEDEARTLEDIYVQSAAQKYLMEKRQVVQKLHQFGIQTIYTKPEELSVNAINKYLELKSRGLI